MLRHTFSTRCIESRMNALVLSKILGHKNIEITLNVYTSVFNKFTIEELNKINDVFLNKCLPIMVLLWYLQKNKSKTF